MYRGAAKFYSLILPSGTTPGSSVIVAAPGAGYALEILSARTYNKNTAGNYQELRDEDSQVFVGVFAASKTSCLERLLLKETDRPVLLPENKAYVWLWSGANSNSRTSVCGQYRIVRVAT